jgi:hypothetical protein
VFLLCTIRAVSQKSIGLEQSVYYSKQTSFTFVPVISLQSKKGWCAETRFNYEDIQTVSLHFGKTFSKESGLSYSLTPMLGGLIGNTNGVSLGSNIELNYKKLNWLTQTQYVFSKQDFIYTWSELFYSPAKWLYMGSVLQHTYLKDSGHVWEPGVGIGFSVKNLSITAYDFVALSSNSQTFVVSLAFQKE